MMPEQAPVALVERAVRWLCGRVLPRIPYPVLRGPLKGQRFILGAAAGGGGGASVYINRVEPGGTRALVSVLRPGQVVFDVGANVGYYTLLASRQVGPSGRVVAFEPLVRNLSFLHRHVTLNEVSNVTVVPLGCSDRTGLAVLIGGPNCATAHLQESPSVPHGTGPLEYIGVVTIDEIVLQTGLVPDVVKIDVEGAEELVLRGGVRTFESARPTLLLSVHSDSLRAACTSFMTRLGYTPPQMCSEPWGDAELLFTARDVSPRSSHPRNAPARAGATDNRE
jgi:FkbM family methyltransferase